VCGSRTSSLPADASVRELPNGAQYCELRRHQWGASGFIQDRPWGSGVDIWDRLLFGDKRLPSWWLCVTVAVSRPREGICNGCMLASAPGRSTSHPGRLPTIKAFWKLVEKLMGVDMAVEDVTGAEA
jgi:hypothetical protein